MNRLVDARADLAIALAPVLSGRVDAYPPTAKFATPRIFLEQPELDRTTFGTRSQGTTQTWEVWIAYDGAQRAQVAGLDELVAAAWDTLEATRGVQPQRARRATLDVAGVQYRATVIDVAVTHAATTLCPPDTAAVTIPPEPVAV